MKRRTLVLVLGFCLLVFAGGAALAAKPVIRVSGQPCLHGMPTWLAIEEKADADKPFELQFMLFTSGAPQVEAMAADQWDVGAMGTIPCMMASLRYGALLIGISNDESETNDIWVRPDSPLLKHKGANPKFPDLYGTAEDWKGKKILATTVSTGHYALSASLAALGLKDSDVKIVHMEQGQALAAFGAGEGDIIQLWAPSSYLAEAKGWVKVSSGRRAGATVPGGIMVRKEFAEKHPDLVTAWLGIYMNYIHKMQADPQGNIEPLYKYFTEYCGLELNKEMVAQEFKLRPLFDVKEQVALLTDPGKAATWMRGVAQFLLNQGRITQKEFDKYVQANCYIDASFMKALEAKKAGQ
ncbi:MAG: ABC transporter substrate-binding protein [Solidesulfovibrio sp. DCME]|uniref:ABC transporter substrate-binding protein n=1 Tax=Solidesulfovibrio sp. DCME TaxID=3447380 RepID=UPI003D0E35F4